MGRHPMSMPAKIALLVLLWARGAVAQEAGVSVTAPPEPDGKAWELQATSEFRSLFINDVDPANDRQMLYVFRGLVDAFEDTKLFVRVGLRQRFVDEPEESGLDLQDTRFGVRRSTPVDLGARKLDLTHTGEVYLPTSRASQNQDLFVAPQVKTQASIEIIEKLTAGLTPRFRYRFHEFAERAGLDGGMNTQLDFGLRLDAGYVPISDPDCGDLSIDAGVETNYSRMYDSRDDHLTDTSDQGLWLQDYGWDLTLSYTPVKYVTASVGVEHGGDVLRDGVVNTFFTHREETELVFTVAGRY